MRTPDHIRSVKNGANSNGVKTGSEMRDNAKQSIGVSRQCLQTWGKPKSNREEFQSMAELVNATTSNL